MFSFNSFVLIFTINFFVITLVNLVEGQEIPPTPCSDVFQYYRQANGDIYGRITVPNDGSTNLNLAVNASMKGYYTDRRKVSLKIKMNTNDQDLIYQRANTLSYSIYFPFQHSIPRITNIVLNNRRHCSGPPEELIPGSPGVTNLWAGHRFYFQKADKGAEGPDIPEFSDPSVDIGEPVSPSGRDPSEVFSISFNNPFFNQPLDNTVSPDVPTRNQFQYQGCGISRAAFTPLILGGNEISDGMFPWLAAMFASVGTGYEYKCTGNLVSDKHVITAARCVSLYRTPLFDVDDLLFVFGKSNLRNWAANGAVTRGVSKVLTHPDFNQNSGHGDLSVITLKRSIQFSDKISPICLWSGNNGLTDVVSKRGTVAGWGADTKLPKPGRYSTTIAKSIDIPIVSQNDCLFSNLTYYSLTSESTFCAGQRNGKGICIGDSGAGFMMYRTEKFYLRGVVSMPLINSQGECDTTFFMIFCDIAKYTNWIEDVMRQ